MLENNSKTYFNLIQLNLQFVFAYILIHFRENSSLSRSPSPEEENKTQDVVLNLKNENLEFNRINEQLSRLNAYYHSLQSKLIIRNDLYKLDSILEDYLKLTKKYLTLIESDSWTSSDLSNAFDWLNDKFIRKMIQMTTQLDANDSLCAYFVKFFNDFVYLFRIDFELIKSKVNFVYTFN